MADEDIWGYEKVKYLKNIVQNANGKFIENVLGFFLSSRWFHTFLKKKKKKNL